MTDKAYIEVVPVLGDTVEAIDLASSTALEEECAGSKKRYQYNRATFQGLFPSPPTQR